MSTLSSHDFDSVVLSPSAPAKHYSRLIKFNDEIAEHEPHQASTTVDIYSDDNNEWYCQVCRGGQKTQAMGPYTKRQAERVQDARRTRIATKGTAWLIFEKTEEGESDESG
ncbi:hypothetical protein [Rhizobium leguminosarum]|uniref:hypothetical protein n=1 Tax=Rhizobium leguminosarum TaxID=384 RepID=UPI001C903E21|nr:hypothetical protein [Rhizobium leguminosarum]MBY3044181.1 hypothetical protein [Rhizobium leguminosarum]